MDLQQLRVFTIIAREGSLARASASLFLSQPAVSAQLKALEETLGLKLFERKSRGMALTRAGEILLGEATKALETADNVLKQAKKLRGIELTGNFRLGTISDPVMLRLSTLFSLITQLYPDLKPSICQGISGDIIERIVEGSIEAGYVIGKPAHPKIASFKVAPVTLRIAAPVKWKEKVAAAGWPEIGQMPWISTPHKCSFRQIAERMLARHGATPQTVIEADQEMTLCDLVQQGLGLTLLREDIALAAEAAGKLVIWSPGIEIEHLYFVHLNVEENAALMQGIIPLVKQIWNVPA